MSSIFSGVALSAIAGLGTGSALWPMKKMRQYKFEHYWFIGMLPLFIIPWVVVLAGVGNPWAAYAAVGWKPLIISNLFAVGWGVANVLAGRCAERIGLSLTGAILTGVGASLAVILPMIFKGTGLFENSPDIFSLAGLTVLSGVAIMLGGVFLAALAGFGREKIANQRSEKYPTVVCAPAGSFRGGLVMAIIAGALSVGPSLAFVYSQGPIIAAMKAQGAGVISANFGVWAGGFVGGAVINLAYPVWLIIRKRSWSVFFQKKSEAALALLIGSQLIVAFALQGLGMVALGAVGASVGVGIAQAMQILGGQGAGFISGEWKGIGGKPRARMIAAVIFLFFAIVIMVRAR
ncbi:hypothetical protein EPN28_00505 [Patescibacteria group bacterium]|nr:MAG: hypothetical protein EPN28_00505 [Patescibacteria group bacterium]